MNRRCIIFILNSASLFPLVPYLCLSSELTPKYSQWAWIGLQVFWLNFKGCRWFLSLFNKNLRVEMFVQRWSFKCQLLFYVSFIITDHILGFIFVFWDCNFMGVIFKVNFVWLSEVLCQFFAAKCKWVAAYDIRKTLAFYSGLVMIP